MDQTKIYQAIRLALSRPHDFTLQYPVRREFFQDRYAILSNNLPSSTSISQSLVKSRKWLLYLHVPFCVSKCFYCNFAVDTRSSDSFLVPESLKSRYIENLCQQISGWQSQLQLDDSTDCLNRLDGIDIGGGTPTALPIHFLEKLLKALQPLNRSAGRSSKPDTFLSIETTPSIACREPDKLHLLVALGVTRCSVGIQSTNATTLSQVNRAEQIQTAETALTNMRAAGFRRVSADLIFALPGQSMDDWRQDLERVAALQPDTITTYDCLYRGKGRAMVRRIPPSWPQPAQYGRMYDYAYEYLTQKQGYHAPYGSVNFSRRADETGVSSYFEGRLLDNHPYLGLGNYASSMVGDQWFFAPYHVDSWLTQVESAPSSSSSPISPSPFIPSPPFPVQYGYDLPAVERMAKYLLLSLSFGFLDARRFEAAFPGHSFTQLFGAEMAFAEQQGWLRHLIHHDQDRYYMTPGSFEHVNQIRSLLYSAACLDWFEARLAEPPAEPTVRRKSKSTQL